MVEKPISIKFFLPTKEMPCFLRELFSQMEIPCNGMSENGLTLQGVSFSGAKAVVILEREQCFFYGLESDYEEARNTVCLKRTCHSGI